MNKKNEEFYNALIKDKGIYEQIEKIRSQAWVKEIEGS